MKTPKPLCRWRRGVGAAALAFVFALLGVSDVLAQAKKPNILVIWGDDIGYWNISVNNDIFSHEDMVPTLLAAAHVQGIPAEPESRQLLA